MVTPTNTMVDEMAGYLRHRKLLHIVTVALLTTLIATDSRTASTAEDVIVAMLMEARPYHTISAELFEELGWNLPDGGDTSRSSR